VTGGTVQSMAAAARAIAAGLGSHEVITLETTSATIQHAAAVVRGLVGRHHLDLPVPPRKLSGEAYAGVRASRVTDCSPVAATIDASPKSARPTMP
jgi:hypothetical protein